MDRMTRDEYGLALVDVIRKRAACIRRQVGAVILDENGRIVATGYNGAVSGALHCTDGGCPRGADRTVPVLNVSAGNGMAGAPPCIAWHAERNAIVWALKHNAHMPTCTLYISCPSCPDCARLAAGVGLGRVVVAAGLDNVISTDPYVRDRRAFPPLRRT